MTNNPLNLKSTTEILAINRDGRKRCPYQWALTQERREIIAELKKRKVYR